MNKLNELIDLYEELDSPHEPIRKKALKEFEAFKADLEEKLILHDNLVKLLISDKDGEEGMITNLKRLKMNAEKFKNIQESLDSKRSIFMPMKDYNELKDENTMLKNLRNMDTDSLISLSKENKRLLQEKHMIVNYEGVITQLKEESKINDIIIKRDNIEIKRLEKIIYESNIDALNTKEEIKRLRDEISKHYISWGITAKERDDLEGRISNLMEEHGKVHAQRDMLSNELKRVSRWGKDNYKKMEALKEELAGEKLLSEVRRKHGIEFMLEIKQLKEEIEHMYKTGGVTADYLGKKMGEIIILKDALQMSQLGDDETWVHYQDVKKELETVKDKLGNELQVKYLEIESLNQKVKLAEMVRRKIPFMYNSAEDELGHKR